MLFIPGNMGYLCRTIFGIMTKKTFDIQTLFKGGSKFILCLCLMPSK